MRVTNLGTRTILLLWRYILPVLSDILNDITSCPVPLSKSQNLKMAMEIPVWGFPLLFLVSDFHSYFSTGVSASIFKFWNFDNYF